MAWDASKSVNVRWKTPIPGLSHSSPVVWGNKVFVVSAVTSGAKDETRFGLYGDVAPVKDDPKHTWKVYALDKANGKILWERVAFDGMPKVKRHPKSTHAASTPVTDGKYLVAVRLARSLRVRPERKARWKQDLGVLDAGWFYDVDYQWEYGSSPIIYKNMVIVQADIQKNSFIAAYDLKTGNNCGKRLAKEILPWSSPTCTKASTRVELITGGPKAIRGYDPATGKELWKPGRCPKSRRPRPFIAHDLIFVTSGYPPIQPIYAIKAGRERRYFTEGKTGLKRVHRLEQSSAVAHTCRRRSFTATCFTLFEPGRVDAYNAKTGERVYQERLGGTAARLRLRQLLRTGRFISPVKMATCLS